MMIVDRRLAQRQRDGRPIRVALVGPGFMGSGVIRQIVRSVPGLRLVAVGARRPQVARAILDELGVDPVRDADTPAAISRAIAGGAVAVGSDALALCAADGIDCLIDATGAIEFGARLALTAIDHGKPLVSMNVELEATVGAILHHRARRAGVLLTLSDGDQPGVQMNLYRFVRGIGLTPLLCGNVKGLHDPCRNPTTQRAFAERWGQNPRMVTSFADGSKISFEQAAVANATGMGILRRGMSGIAHQGHVDELVSCFDPEALRAAGGVVDYVVGARPAPGVFVLAGCEDARQRHYLDLYKLGKGPLYSFYTPYHLCHFEVPLSVVRAVDFGDAVLQCRPEGPTVEVIAAAKTDLRAGTVLDGIGGYHCYGLCEAASVVRRENLLPMGLAEGCTLLRDLPRDAPIPRDAVRLPQGRTVDRLRAEQEAHFAGGQGR